jgi:mannose-6-phosphate isomerase-like protein (cupin superfamily)
MTMLRLSPAVSVLALLSACAAAPARQGRLSSPTSDIAGTVWTSEEQAQAIAIRNLSRTESTSFHLVRAQGAEKPHVHELSDLTVVILSGSVRAHLGERVVDAGPGDVISIPRGTPHWVENIGPEASESLALFSPPFDGKDRRFLNP